MDPVVMCMLEDSESPSLESGSFTAAMEVLKEDQ